MIIKNQTSRTATGVFFFLGLSFLISGILALFIEKWIFAAIQLPIAGFLLLSYSGVEINTDNRLFRNYNMFFGLIKTGKWKSLDNYIGLTLVPLKTIYRSFSQSNRSFTDSKRDFCIYFVNKQKRPALLIKKCKTFEKAHQSMDEFSIWLKMPVYSIKRNRGFR